ncbi:hypothetical protein [Rhodovulum visakhapatnamense]|uniref:MerR-like DNA binding protein n=1 Tax=Rhodovulum visakhapatnamense TaxID=364297 RepID=A0A4V3GTS1_9RHOB|nr:hypothetical protein [Rhodovulum visakhapatnamense]TDX28023.1 hypothetical protein EV657_113104 [Rhodovulum visakhapatnamense]
MDFWNETWKAEAVAKAAGLPKEKLQLWLGRNHVLGQGMGGGGEKGRHRRFEFRNVMEIAIARALVDQGHRPADAFKAAAVFAYSAVQHPGTPGLPLDPVGGDTFMAVAGDKVTINYLPTGRGAMADFLADLTGPEGNERDLEAFTMVNASAVFRAVCRELTLDASAILREVKNQ